jgi:hypothetical protein
VIKVTFGILRKLSGYSYYVCGGADREQQENRMADKIEHQKCECGRELPDVTTALFGQPHGCECGQKYYLDADYEHGFAWCKKKILSEADVVEYPRPEPLPAVNSTTDTECVKTAGEVMDEIDQLIQDISDVIDKIYGKCSAIRFESKRSTAFPDSDEGRTRLVARLCAIRLSAEIVKFRAISVLHSIQPVFKGE